MLHSAARGNCVQRLLNRDIWGLSRRNIGVPFPKHKTCWATMLVVHRSLSLSTKPAECDDGGSSQSLPGELRGF